MANIKELKELALHAVRGTAPANYTAETVDEALRGEIASICVKKRCFRSLCERQSAIISIQKRLSLSILLSTV